MTELAPKPGPHLPTLAELAELHARQAHALTTDPTAYNGELVERLAAAEAHAAVARACAHAAIASRPPRVHTPHPQGTPLLDARIRAGVAAALADRDAARGIGDAQ